ncbi:hypothetical protein GGR54DRAFT_635012 [Hypoxylon sp. NC1633]|nr:hypothetical protein GGR54DRAFT_635012 [Hypoxylon sp. NC1633]
MRLINCHHLRLEEFAGQAIPQYAILSHTWEGEEITFADFNKTISDSVVLRGYHFRFNQTIAPTLPDHTAFQLISKYPEKRWDAKFGFRAKDAHTFVGFNTYRLTWLTETPAFIIACGFGPAIEPWTCISKQGSELWYAAHNHDYLRVRELGSQNQDEQITIRSRAQPGKVYVNVEVRPIYGEDDEPKWMQVELHADRKRNHGRLQNRPRRRLAPQLLGGYLEG